MDCEEWSLPGGCSLIVRTLAAQTFFFFFFFMAVDKFYSLGVLTFSTHHKQLCAEHYVLHPSHRNAKNLVTHLSTALDS